MILQVPDKVKMKKTLTARANVSERAATRFVCSMYETGSRQDIWFTNLTLQIEFLFVLFGITAALISRVLKN